MGLFPLWPFAYWFHQSTTSVFLLKENLCSFYSPSSQEEADSTWSSYWEQKSCYPWIIRQFPQHGWSTSKMKSQTTGIQLFPLGFNIGDKDMFKECNTCYFISPMIRGLGNIKFFWKFIFGLTQWCFSMIN